MLNNRIIHIRRVLSNCSILFKVFSTESYEPILLEFTFHTSGTLYFFIVRLIDLVYFNNLSVPQSLSNKTDYSWKKLLHENVYLMTFLKFVYEIA